MINIYKYVYDTASVNGIFSKANHRELIDKYSKEGWRFVAAIPTAANGHGAIQEFDLIFEKEENEK